MLRLSARDHLQWLVEHTQGGDGGGGPLLPLLPPPPRGVVPPPSWGGLGSTGRYWVHYHWILPLDITIRHPIRYCVHYHVNSP